MSPANNIESEQLEAYKKTDSLLQGRDRQFMTVDSWNQDGNYYARFDEFGPEMKPEDPPTLNGKPVE